MCYFKKAKWGKYHSNNGCCNVFNDLKYFLASSHAVWCKVYVPSLTCDLILHNSDLSDGGWL